MIDLIVTDVHLMRESGEVVSCPDPTPKSESGSGIYRIALIFRGFLISRIWNRSRNLFNENLSHCGVTPTGNPIRLLDLLQSCDMKCRLVGFALRNVDRNTPLPNPALRASRGWRPYPDSRRLQTSTTLLFLL